MIQPLARVPLGFLFGDKIEAYEKIEIDLCAFGFENDQNMTLYVASAYKHTVLNERFKSLRSVRARMSGEDMDVEVFFLHYIYIFSMLLTVKLRWVNRTS